MSDERIGCSCGYGSGRHRLLKGNCPGRGARIVMRRRAQDLWALSFWITFPDGAMTGPYRRRAIAETIGGVNG